VNNTWLSAGIDSFLTRSSDSRLFYFRLEAAVVVVLAMYFQKVIVYMRGTPCTSGNMCPESKRKRISIGCSCTPQPWFFTA